MPGIGKTHAPFLVVVGHPEKEEDAAGKLGTGKFMRLLVGMLKDAGYKGEDVRITTAVRCAPYEYPPDTEEINACRDYLIREITSVNPRSVIAVGDVALRSLCRDSGVMSKRGSPRFLHMEFGLPELEVWPVYSPTLLMKTPNYRAVIVEDLRRVRTSFMKPETITYAENVVPETLGSVVSFDVETDFDHRTKTGGENVVQSSYSFRDSGSVIQNIVLSGPVHGLPGASGDKNNHVLVTHNGWEFDLPKCGHRPQGRDTMCLAWLDDESQPKGLEALACKYAGAVPWKQDQTAPAGSDLSKAYSARDSYYTLLVYEKLIERLGPRVKIADLIIFPAFLALQDCTKRGIYISQKVVDDLLYQFNAEEELSLHALQEYVGDIQPWCRNVKKTALAYKKPTKFNPGSPHQVSEFFERINTFTTPTKSGDWSTDAKAMEKADLPPDFRKPLEMYRHAKKMKNTYLEPLTQLGEDGRIHPHYFLYPRVFATGGEGGGTASGRLTATLNALTLPREMKNAGLYSAPSGKILAECDFGTLEFRLAMWYAQSKLPIEKYKENKNWDAHEYFARVFYDLKESEPVSKEMRQTAKSANFALTFGGYWKTTVEYAAGLGLNMPDEQAQRLENYYHTAYPEIKPWWKQNENFVKKHGYIETPTGRRRNFGPWEYISQDMRSSINREATNMLTQSLGHDLTLLALTNAHKENLEVVLEWHDSLWVELPEDVDRKAFELKMQEIMIVRPLKTLKEEFGVNLDVPLIIDVKYFENG